MSTDDDDNFGLFIVEFNMRLWDKFLTNDCHVVVKILSTTGL